MAKRKHNYMVMMMNRCKIKAYNGKQQDGKTKKKEEKNNTRI